MPQRTPMEEEHPPGTMRLLHEAFQARRRNGQGFLAAGGYEGITLTHARVLQHVVYTGGSLSAIARRSGISRQAVAKAAADLEAMGYLKLEASAADRRRYEATLRPSGRRLFKTLRQSIKQDEENLQHLLGPKRYQALRSMLQQMIDAHGAKQIPPPGR